MTETSHILIVDDDEDILVAGKLLLKRHVKEVSICNTPEQIPTLMKKHQFDAILLDMNFGPGESSGKQGFHWLKKIMGIDPQVVVVIITAHGNMDMAVQAIKLGATDFVAKPWQNEKLVATLSTAVKLGQSRAKVSRLQSRQQELSNTSGETNRQPLIGQSIAIQEVQSVIDKSAPTDANIMILGENGTGKELAAREIHKLSQRAEQVFVSVDLGAVSESLFESELFGHKKGAFTGANADRIGRILAADGGTLFLDEIGNLPLHLQAKLLTVLAQRQVMPLGSDRPVTFDVRVVSATNLPLKQLHDESQFRQDLLFRLNTVTITMPPLRDRRSDIPLLATHYVQYYARKYLKPDKHLGENALLTMSEYDWPGNIRALRHAIERAVILSQESEISPADLQLARTPSSTDESNESSKQSATAQNTTLPELNLEKLEKMAIHTALQQHHYNISHAAKTLGLTRAALYRRMEKHGL
ncbi:MAG: sigma-54-dependent transcriptional regulator [Aestuariibacter sp.]